MKCFVNLGCCRLAVIAVALLAAHQAAAVPLTLNLIQAQSKLTITGSFGGIPVQNQEGTAGTTDLVPALPSNTTTFQGTISVDVDSVFAPTSIKITGSAADADLSGQWLPEVQLYADLNGDGSSGDFGLPPAGDSQPTQGDDPKPATDADWGIKVRHPAFGVDLAYGAYRDIAYNITSGVEAVDGLGQFSSATEDFKFATGWLDYWVAPAAGNERGRAELAGGHDKNTIAGSSTYVVTPLGGGLSQITLTLPVHVDDGGTDLHSFYDGTIVATVVVPEPATVSLLALASVVAGMLGMRTRK